MRKARQIGCAWLRFCSFVSRYPTAAKKVRLLLFAIRIRILVSIFKKSRVFLNLLGRLFCLNSIFELRNIPKTKKPPVVEQPRTLHRKTRAWHTTTGWGIVKIVCLPIRKSALRVPNTSLDSNKHVNSGILPQLGFCCLAGTSG